MRMSDKQFAATLRDLASRIEEGDSLEGGLSYGFVEKQAGEAIMEVRGAVRIGNTQGQGSMRVFDPVQMENLQFDHLRCAESSASASEPFSSEEINEVFTNLCKQTGIQS